MYRARKFYNTIKFIRSPGLGNEKIIFNNIGFNHLIRKGRAKRPEKEQLKRFRLLVYVGIILKNPKPIIVKRGMKRKYFIEHEGVLIAKIFVVKYWTFIHVVDDESIKLVVRSVGQGQKHFFSIMSKRVRSKNP